MSAALGLLGLLALGPGEPPSASVRTGVLPLRTEGSLPKHRKVKLEKTIIKGLQRGEFDVIEPAQLAEAVPRAGCKDARCATEVAAKVDARYLVQPTIEVQQSDLTFTLELLDGTSGEVIAHADEVCEICSDHEAETTARSLGASLGRTLAAKTRALPKLTVNSNPRGARVLIDGEEVGTTPLNIEVEPGAHEVELSAPSRLSQTRQLELVAGVEEELTVELERIPERPSRIPAWAGWATLAVGVAATGGGAAMLAIHQQPIRYDCTDANVDADGDCRYRYNTLVGGATLTAVGVAALSTGVVLLVMRRLGRTPEQATLRPSPGGLVLRF